MVTARAKVQMPGAAIVDLTTLPDPRPVVQQTIVITRQLHDVLERASRRFQQAHSTVQSEVQKWEAQVLQHRLDRRHLGHRAAPVVEHLDSRPWPTPSSSTPALPNGKATSAGPGSAGRSFTRPLRTRGQPRRTRGRSRRSRGKPWRARSRDQRVGHDPRMCQVSSSGPHRVLAGHQSRMSSWSGSSSPKPSARPRP